MDKKELEDKAAELFPLPDKKDYEGAGEAYVLESAIVLEKRKIYMKGWMDALENT